MSTAWIFEYGNEIVGAREKNLTRQKVFYCGGCDRVWERTNMHGIVEYFTRKDLAFYGFPKRVCRGCK